MVTRPTNHMILTRDHSHDLLTWSWHVTTHMITARDLRTSSWHQVIIDTNICVMTTSESLVSHTITTSSHHHGTRRPSSKGPSVGLEQGCFGGPQGRLLQDQRQSWNPVVVAGSKGSALNCYNRNLIKRKCLQSLQTTKGAMSEVRREDGWPDAAWPDFLGRQRQLQPWNIILLDE